jgi:hypothetical protein
MKSDACPFKELDTALLHMQGSMQKPQILKKDWKVFERAWHQGLKEIDPGPGDTRQLVMTNTRTAGDEISKLPYRLQNMVTIGLASYLPENVLILRESVETREAADGTWYRRTIRACLRKDGLIEFGMWG